MNKQKKINEMKSQVISLRFFNIKKVNQKEVAKILQITVRQVQRYEKKYKKDLT